MPRTFKATEKRYIDDAIIDPGKNPVFTTSYFDDKDRNGEPREIPETLVELDPVSLKPLDKKKPKKVELVGTSEKTLSEMTVKELKSRAKKNGMELPNGLKQIELVIAIESFEGAGGSGDETIKVLQDPKDPIGAGLSVKSDSIGEIDPI